MSDAAPDALLFVAPGCPHCPGMLARLGERVKDGRLGRLEVVNVARHPERAEALGLRSVPWTRIGPFELAGDVSEREIDGWIEAAARGTGRDRHLAQLLADGRLDRVEALVEETPARLHDLVEVLADAQAPIQVRLGVAAVLEGLAGDPRLAPLVPRLGELSRHPEARVRNDACHLLGLTASPAARPFLEMCRDDADAEVREVAAEALAALPPPPA